MCNVCLYHVYACAAFFPTSAGSGLQTRCVEIMVFLPIAIWTSVCLTISMIILKPSEDVWYRCLCPLRRPLWTLQTLIDSCDGETKANHYDMYYSWGRFHVTRDNSLAALFLAITTYGCMFAEFGISPYADSGLQMRRVKKKMAHLSTAIWTSLRESLRSADILSQTVENMCYVTILLNKPRGYTEHLRTFVHSCAGNKTLFPFWIVCWWHRFMLLVTTRQHMDLQHELMCFMLSIVARDTWLFTSWSHGSYLFLSTTSKTRDTQKWFITMIECQGLCVTGALCRLMTTSNWWRSELRSVHHHWHSDRSNICCVKRLFVEPCACFQNTRVVLIDILRLFIIYRHGNVHDGTRALCVWLTSVMI